MATVPEALSEQDLRVAEQLIRDLEKHGRGDEALVVARLLARVELDSHRAPSGPLEDELSTEDLAAIDRGLADIAAGRIVPHEVVLRGAEAVEAYVVAYRTARDARLRAAAGVRAAAGDA
jgi:predicted transcriptional regulator